MAHEIYDTDSVIYSRATPWHGLGVRLPKDATSDFVREVVFPWRAVRSPVFNADGTAIPGWSQLTRSDSGSLLNVIPDSTGVVQYSDALSILDAAGGDARYITAGTLRGGKAAWVLADLPSSQFDIAGSTVMPYLLLTASHDGSLGAVRVHFTGIYVVCSNTVNAALRAAGVEGLHSARNTPDVITLRHTKNAEHRVRQCAALVHNARQYFGAFNAAALQLVNTKIARSELVDILAELFPAPETGKTDRAGDAAACQRMNVLRLFDGAQRATGARGTAWSAYMAITEALDHGSNHRNRETRFTSLVSGGASVVRQKAMNLLLAA